METEITCRSQLVFLTMKGRQTILGGYCTQYLQYSVYTVLSVCCTWCIVYLVYAVLGVCCTWYILYLELSHNYSITRKNDLTQWVTYREGVFGQVIDSLCNEWH
jgi:hypothetical protein